LWLLSGTAVTLYYQFDGHEFSVDIDDVLGGRGSVRTGEASFFQQVLGGGKTTRYAAAC
jgi:hypothetical protein